MGLQEALLGSIRSAHGLYGSRDPSSPMLQGATGGGNTGNNPGGEQGEDSDSDSGAQSEEL